MAASPQIQWVNYFDLHPSDGTTIVTPDIDINGGLLIASTNAGDVDGNNANKTVFMALEVPEQARVTRRDGLLPVVEAEFIHRADSTGATQSPSRPATRSVWTNTTAMNSATAKCDRKTQSSKFRSKGKWRPSFSRCLPTR
jgi:hypothetical protein